MLMSDTTFASFAPAQASPTSIFGYEIIDRIGEGAGSLVYAVSQPGTGQIFALKHVIRKSEKDVRFIEQLENEYNVGKQIVHPSLRRVVDFKANRTVLRKFIDAALVLELFDGSALEQHLPTDLLEILDCFIATAGALGAMHDHGFIHCDLKPNNIMRNARGDVKVIDLGQACPIGTAKERIQGTPDFISPEQVHCKPVSKPTDVFNFGATLYWALARKPMPTLFTITKGENSFLLDDTIPTPADANPAVPAPLSNFVMECVRTNPAKRPQDMTEVIRRLEVMRHVVERDHKPRRFVN
ncbi:MAG: serine/threonine protein kinase [Phycisphaerae bacterium]|nr:serine/threonine protein kinase [Phycisphaerae bacterium]